MTKNEMNYDEQQHQVVRGRDDIKVGDKVAFKDNKYFDAGKIGIVNGVRRGWLFKRYEILEANLRFYNPGAVIRMWKKYRWQLFKINN